MEVSTSTAGSGLSNSVANLGTITLHVFDRQITRKSHSAGGRVATLGQSSEVAEKDLKGRDVTLQAKYANTDLVMI